MTGAGRGIGRAIALVLAEAGASIVATARTEPEIQATASSIREMGGNAISILSDVSDSSSVDSMVSEAQDRLGNIDIMVNNAGRMLRVPVTPFPDKTLKPPEVTRESTTRVTDKEWQEVLNTNLNGVYYCCRAIAPQMIENRYGKIINIGSNNASQAFPMVAAYNASKAAVNMLTRVLALEWAPYNICINTIGPGPYHTRLSNASWTDSTERQKRLDSIPLGREGKLRDLGILATYLASPASDFMTGQTIYLDGGMTAR